MDKIKEFVKKYKKHIGGAVIVLLILVWAFWYGGNAPGARGFKLEKTEEGVTTEAAGGMEMTEATKSATEENTDAGNDKKKKSDSSVTDTSSGTHSDSDTSETEYQTSDESASENVTERNTETTTEKKTEATTKKNTTTESQKTTEKKPGTTTTTEKRKPDKTTADSSATTKATTENTTEAPKKTYSCTISIGCSTIFDNLELLRLEKKDYVPDDGVILGTVTATFEEGDTVFEVLKSVCRDYGIQLEYSWTPMYGSYYIEGIHNLYEFDCGDGSGWMYSVNGWFPNYGCSSYELKQGDVIKWLYTCDLGADVGSEMH